MPSNPDQRVIELLNEVLTAELTAINQYFLHAKLCANWGFKRLADKIRHESIDEMKHADQIIERILYLGGIPNVQRLARIRIGENVPEMFESDIALEVEAIPRLNQGIALVRELGDNGTRVLLDEILVSEEEHLDWLEEQKALIETMGLQGYLTTQVHP